MKPKKNDCMLLQVLLTLILSLLLTACVTLEMKPTQSYEPALPQQSKLSTPITNGSIYHADTAMRLFEDHRARRVGDIIVVVLNESANASKSASTSTSKENTLDTSVTSLFGTTMSPKGRDLLKQNTSTANEFSGSGDSEQKSAINATIAVTVHRVLGNGNLVVRGQKRLFINRGEEFIQLSGIVRASDISTDNSVQSMRVADAYIKYSGRGQVANSNIEGWLSRFFNSKFWPL